ncbi:MAG: magnesium chelatase, partial [Pirellulaceae bacterium]
KRAPMTSLATTRPKTLAELQASGWTSRSVKAEIRENFLKCLSADEPLYPGIIGYEDTVIPEINIAILAGHDMLFIGEKGQAKSRLMRGLVRFLDEYLQYLDIPH